MLKPLKRRASLRARSLFSVACCRRIDHLIVDAASRRAVDAAQRWADGEMTDMEASAVREEAWCVVWEAMLGAHQSEDGEPIFYLPRTPALGRRCCAAKAAHACLAQGPRTTGLSGSYANYSLRVPETAFALTYDALDREGYDWEPTSLEGSIPRAIEDLGTQELRVQCDILRDLFGDRPSPPVVDLGQGWVAWNEGFLTQFADAIYQTEEFEQLPLLADALAASGCTDSLILGHLRDARPHWRGCWALEMLITPKLPPRPPDWRW